MAKGSHQSFVVAMVCGGLLLAAGAMRAAGDNAATTAPAEKTDGVLYDDPAAHSSATITQVIGNAVAAPMTLENIRRIRVKEGILIIEWGHTATTLLPRQFVSAITINKRAPAATQPARH